MPQYTDVVVYHLKLTPETLAAVLWEALCEQHKDTPGHVASLLNEHIELTRAAVRKTVRVALQRHGTPDPDRPLPDYTPEAQAWCLEQIDHAAYPWYQ